MPTAYIAQEQNVKAKNENIESWKKTNLVGPREQHAHGHIDRHEVAEILAANKVRHNVQVVGDEKGIVVVQQVAVQWQRGCAAVARTDDHMTGYNGRDEK